jgi:hypothetical protein
MCVGGLLSGVGETEWRGSAVVTFLTKIAPKSVSDAKYNTQCGSSVGLVTYRKKKIRHLGHTHKKKWAATRESDGRSVSLRLVVENLHPLLRMASKDSSLDGASLLDAQEQGQLQPKKESATQISKLVYVDDDGAEVCYGTGETDKALLVSAFANARSLVIALRRKVAELESTYSLQQAVIGEHEKTSASMRELAIAQSATINELKKRCDEASSKESEAVAATDRIRAQLEQVAAERCSVVGEWKRRVECLVAEGRGRIVQWQKRFDEMEAERERLAAEKERLAADNASLRIRVSALEDDDDDDSSSDSSSRGELKEHRLVVGEESSEDGDDENGEDDDGDEEVEESTLDPRTVLGTSCNVLVMGGLGSGKFNVCVDLLFNEIGKFDDVVVLSEMRALRNAKLFTMKSLESAVVVAENEYERLQHNHRTVFVLETKGAVSYSGRRLSDLVRRMEKIRSTIIWSIGQGQLVFATQEVQFNPDVICLTGFSPSSSTDARDLMLRAAHSLWFNLEYESEEVFCEEYEAATTSRGDCLLGFHVCGGDDDDEDQFAVVSRASTIMPNGVSSSLKARLQEQATKYAWYPGGCPSTHC